MANSNDKMDIPEWEFRLVFGTTKIEYAPEKELSNRQKHGYSLESAVTLFERIVFPFNQSSPWMTSDGFCENGEVRHMHMTVDDNEKVVVAVTTMRPNETIRVISYRRASTKEREQFATETGFVEIQPEISGNDA